MYSIPSTASFLGLILFVFLMQVTPKVSFTQDEIEKLTDRIQNAGTEVVHAKAGAVSIWCNTLLQYIMKYL